MAANNKKIPTVTITTRTRRSSSGSLAPSLKTPRTARFAEATAVHSPIDGRSPFADPPGTNHFVPQPQPSDIGFGYLSTNGASRHVSMAGVEMEESQSTYLPPPTPNEPLKSPLKSALKSPGAPPRTLDNPLSPSFKNAVLSPTFREEQVLEKQEAGTEKEQAKDLKVKFRVRVAKIFLRGINFACSLIVLSMLATTMTVFNATRSLPARSGLPAWAATTQTWPQITMLVIAAISLFMATAILFAYWKGGHQKAEKVAVYYTVFAVGFFIFSIVMWGVAAGILQQAKTTSGGTDIWGWSCKDNKRRTLFQEDVNYDLICRLQDWSLVCAIIEIVLETFTIIIYGIVFYRFYSKRKLRKSMAVRDRARSDLYLAQLRSQSAPNTPGFGPLSPRDGGWMPPPGHPMYKDPLSQAEEGGAQPALSLAAVANAGNETSRAPSVVTQTPKGFAQPKPFTLQPPPIKIQGATPKVRQAGFDSGSPVSAASETSSNAAPLSRTPPLPPSSPVLQTEVRQDHMPAAPGEQSYESVPIPGAYASPLASPTYQQQPQGFDFGLSHGSRK